MPRETLLTAAAARLAGIPFALSRRRPSHAPHKAIILQTCCLSQVMLATPLAAALGTAFPEARLDWAVGDWSKPAVSGNPRITELLLLGREDLRKRSWKEIGQLILRLRSAHYDTAFIPSGSSLLSYIAWQAGIHQRIGLNVNGRGFAHTVAVAPPPEVTSAGQRGLLLASAAGIPEEIVARANMEFYPSDGDRTAVTRLLVEELDWLGDVPLVILHPGGGINPVRQDPLLRWPAARYALLANQVMRDYNARVLLVGSAEETGLAQEIKGMIAGPSANYSGRLSLGELGALCEVADLYVGNDSGPTHIAAASGCQTLAIFGPTNPTRSAPYTTRENVRVLWHDLARVEAGRPFTWDIGVTVEEAGTAVDAVLSRAQQREGALRYVSNIDG